VAILMAALAASPAQAVITAETIEFEAYLGAYLPGPDDVLDTAATFGVRVGYNITQRFNVTGELGFVSTDGDKSRRGRTADVDVDWVVSDFSFVWNIRPNKKFVTTLYAGPGYAFASADIDTPSGSGNRFDKLQDLDDDSFTFHFGFGFKWDMTDNFYLRLASRFRWFENRDEDEIDQEITFGVGWKFGG
jgi:opacity protein-like surface antigen